MLWFPIGIWQKILFFVDSPKEFRNASRVCKDSTIASKNLQLLKADQFKKRIYNHDHTEMYYILPNQRIHGTFIKLRHDTNELYSRSEFSFGKKITENRYH